MDIRKTIRALPLRAGLLLAALVAFTITINLSWFDEPLHPDLERLAVPEAVSMEDNAYPLIYGFPAASDKDPRAAGLAVVEALHERYRAGRRLTLTDDEMGKILGGPAEDDAWRASFSSLTCNSRFSLDCADQVIADIARADTDQPRLRVLLDRYEQILGTRRFEENQEFDESTPVPTYGVLMSIARIKLAASYARDSTPLFLSKVAEDVAFWKRMLREGQTLIAKMVALAGLRNDMAFVSTLMRQRDLDEPDLEALRQFVSPLTSEERDIGEAFLAELRVALLSEKSLAAIPGTTSWITRLSYEKRATLNEYYLSIVTPLRLRASLGPEEFYRERGYERLSYSVRAFPPPLFNLGGKLLLKRLATEFNFQDYISRVHDLDGRIALVLLQAEIESSPGRSVEAVVGASRYRNPYTQRPMDYDAKAQTVGFHCLGLGSDDVCAIATGPVGRERP
jgi:hypothetical protein